MGSAQNQQRIVAPSAQNERAAQRASEKYAGTEYTKAQIQEMLRSRFVSEGFSSAISWYRETTGGNGCQLMPLFQADKVRREAQGGAINTVDGTSYVLTKERAVEIAAGMHSYASLLPPEKKEVVESLLIRTPEPNRLQFSISQMNVPISFEPSDQIRSESSPRVEILPQQQGGTGSALLGIVASQTNPQTTQAKEGCCPGCDALVKEEVKTQPRVLFSESLPISEEVLPRETNVQAVQTETASAIGKSLTPEMRVVANKEEIIQDGGQETSISRAENPVTDDPHIAAAINSIRARSHRSEQQKTFAKVSRGAFFPEVRKNQTPFAAPHFTQVRARMPQRTIVKAPGTTKPVEQHSAKMKRMGRKGKIPKKREVKSLSVHTSKKETLVRKTKVAIATKPRNMRKKEERIDARKIIRNPSMQARSQKLSKETRRRIETNSPTSKVLVGKIKTPVADNRKQKTQETRRPKKESIPARQAEERQKKSQTRDRKSRKATDERIAHIVKRLRMAGRVAHNILAKGPKKKATRT